MRLSCFVGAEGPPSDAWLVCGSVAEDVAAAAGFCTALALPGPFCSCLFTAAPLLQHMHSQPKQHQP